VAVNPSFESLVVDQLSRVVPAVKARRMFGGVGIYSEQAFFALIADDTLYFKVDETTRPEFEARGMEPFRPYGEDGAEMQYYQVPEDVLEDLEKLRTWAESALTVARRKKRKSPRRPRA
jgi:DNA transformation protein